MYQIPLTATANQQVSFNADGSTWTIRLFQAVTSLCIDITRDGTVLLSGSRCLAAQGLMPYDWMRANGTYGNLVFDSDPDWTLFGGGGCNLYYMESAEYDQFEQYLLTGVIPSD